jgi:hypothetical protein
VRKKTLSVMAMAIGVFVLMFASVGAAVTFDPGTGTGFAGKGDVQDAFGWNNAQLQENAADVEFYYEEDAVYSLVCSRIHHIQGYQQQTFGDRVASVEAEVEYDKRRNRQDQITGFNLSSLGEQSGQDATCPSGWPTEESRTLVDSSESGLFAVYGTAKVLIWSADEATDE